LPCSAAWISANEAALTALAEEAQIDVAPASRSDGRTCDVLVDGQDITWETRSRNVDANVSVVSAYRGVRSALTEQQRRIGLRGDVDDRHRCFAGRFEILPDATMNVPGGGEEIIVRGGSHEIPQEGEEPHD
jgi:cytidylate kinase